MFIVQQEGVKREVVGLIGPFETVEDIGIWAKGANLEVFDEGVWVTHRDLRCMPGGPNFFYTYRVVETPRYELFYSSGGHGGPYHGLQCALGAAKRLVESGSECAVQIYDYTRWPNTGKPGEKIPPVATIRRRSVTSEVVEVTY